MQATCGRAWGVSILLWGSAKLPRLQSFGSWRQFVEERCCTHSESLKAFSQLEKGCPVQQARLSSYWVYPDLIQYSSAVTDRTLPAESRKARRRRILRRPWGRFCHGQSRSAYVCVQSLAPSDIQRCCVANKITPEAPNGQDPMLNFVLASSSFAVALVGASQQKLCRGPGLGSLTSCPKCTDQPMCTLYTSRVTGPGPTTGCDGARVLSEVAAATGA